MISMLSRKKAALQAETIFLVTMASRLEFGCYMISNNVLNIVFMVFPTLKLRKIFDELLLILWFLRVINGNYRKILKSDWLSVVLIAAFIDQCNRTVHVMLKWLSTPEITITYHNAVCFSPQNFAEALFSVSLGAILTPKRNWKQCSCKILGRQTKSIMVCYGISGVINWIVWSRPHGLGWGLFAEKFWERAFEFNHD